MTQVLIHLMFQGIFIVLFGTAHQRKLYDRTNSCVVFYTSTCYLITHSLARIIPVNMLPKLLGVLVMVAICHGDDCTPRNFPSNVTHRVGNFINWSEDFEISGYIFAEPKSAQEIVELANWARDNGYRVRPSGYQLSWSPMTTYPVLRSSSDIDSVPCQKIVLVKMHPHMTDIRMEEKQKDQELSAVTAEAGATLDNVLEFIGARNLSFGSMPSLGNMTIGALLAQASHGTGVPIGKKVPGKSSSSIANMVTKLKAIVWNATADSFQEQEFQRSDPRMRALLVNLGRILITQATFRVGDDERYRCLSRTDVPMSVLFAKPQGEEIMENSLADFVNKTGHVGLLFCPFSDATWLRLWTKSPEKPSTSRQVDSPYNYGFQESVPKEVLQIATAAILSSNFIGTPITSELVCRATDFGLHYSRTKDIWGWSRNVFRIVSTAAPKISVSSYAVLTASKNLQKVASEMYSILYRLLEEYRGTGRYPLNAVNEFRVTSVDIAEDVGILGAEAPAFSPSSPHKDYPDFDTVIWLDLVTFSRTYHVSTFLQKIQYKFENKFTGNYALLRPKWSTKFGYCTTTWTPWISKVQMKKFKTRFSDWNSAANMLHELDPDQVFVHALFKELLP